MGKKEKKKTPQAWEEGTRSQLADIRAHVNTAFDKYYGDGQLGPRELPRLATFLMPLGEATARPQRPDASTADDLFGTPIDLGETNAPRIIGPVSPFRRLDVDNDGFVTIDDLQRLEGRSFSLLSLEGVLSTLDLDADGRLSEAEFLASMTGR